MFESQLDWAEKVAGANRSRRVAVARNIVFLVLHEILAVSYNEIGRVLNRRHLSVVGRGIAQARKWRDVPEHAMQWKRIERAVLETIAAEKQFHAESQNIRVGLADK